MLAGTLSRSMLAAYSSTENQTASASLASSAPAAVKASLSHYEESVNHINSDLEDGAALIGQYEIVPTVKH